MTNYRIYRIDSAGKIDGPPLNVQRDSGEDVLEMVGEQMSGQAVEIWDGSRRLATISANREK
jgi:hypothetical protein